MDGSSVGQKVFMLCHNGSDGKMMSFEITGSLEEAFEKARFWKDNKMLFSRVVELEIKNIHPVPDEEMPPDEPV